MIRVAQVFVSICIIIFSVATFLLQSWMSYNVWLSDTNLSPQFAGIINMCLVGVIYWSSQFFTTPIYNITNSVYHTNSVY